MCPCPKYQINDFGENRYFAMKITSIILVILLSISVNAGEPDKVLHEKCLYPTVMLENNSHVPEMRGTGTGVIVKSKKKGKQWENYVLTVGHNLDKTPKHLCQKNGPDQPPVLEEAKYEYIAKVGVYENWSTLKDIKEYPVEVLHDDDEADIGLVRFISDKEMPAAEIYEGFDIYIGNEVVRIGCGVGEPFRVDYGRITSVPASAPKALRNQDLKEVYRFSAPTVQGDSGGPLYHEGKLIALAEAIAGTSAGPFPIPVHHIAYAVPIHRAMNCKEIAKYLKEE